MKFNFLQSLKVKTILGGTVLFSLIVGFLCISLIHITPAHVSMDMSSHGHTAHAASLGNCCDSSTGDHMELWKSTFVGIPQNLEMLMALVAVVLFVALSLADLFPPSRLNWNFLSIQFRQYAREHPNISLYNPLRLAFARGILHSKAF